MRAKITAQQAQDIDFMRGLRNNPHKVAQMRRGANALRRANARINGYAPLPRQYKTPQVRALKRLVDKLLGMIDDILTDSKAFSPV